MRDEVSVRIIYVLARLFWPYQISAGSTFDRQDVELANGL